MPGKTRDESSQRQAQPDGSSTEQRTYGQQGKLNNKTSLQRWEAGLETDASRSASRHDRHQRIRKGIRDGKYMATNSATALEDADARGELNSMQPFERIGPDSTSMDGPVTHERAMRGGIPVRGTDPRQPYYIPPYEERESKLDNTDGLKLKLEANLDIEIELKASIRGDITLSLFA